MFIFFCKKKDEGEVKGRGEKREERMERREKRVGKGAESNKMGRSGGKNMRECEEEDGRQDENERGKSRGEEVVNGWERRKGNKGNTGRTMGEME